MKVHENDTEKDNNHEDDKERDEKVVTGRMMFVSHVNSDLYENIKFFKMFGSNDSPGDEKDNNLLWLNYFNCDLF